MVKACYIDKFEQLIEVGTTFGKNWYRGHATIINELTPYVFRKKLTDEFYKAFRPKVEFEIASDFIRRAPSVYSNLPEQENYIEWLFLMQHHGVPTRLLDWTENILTAAFFAVRDNQRKDGEIWSILPWKLNEESGFDGLPILWQSRIVKFLANEIFHTNPEELANDYSLDSVPKRPVALQPALSHPRYVAQQSCFTLHPYPVKGFTIPEMITNEDHLVRYIIPKDLKPDFLKKLRYLGISYLSLFPDLVGLANDISQGLDYLGWGQPRPLNFREYKE